MSSATKSGWTLSELWLTFVLVGYMTMGRSFAHLGIWPVFVGEATLAAFFLFRGRDTLGRFIASLLAPRIASLFAWACLLSIAYGLLETARGLLHGYSPSATLQNLVFHVYPLYLFVGMAVAEKRPNFLARVTPIVAWANGIYGLAYLLVLAPLGFTDDLDMHRVAPFGQPCWTGVIILALISFHARAGSLPLLLLLNGVVLLAIQSRTEWITLAIALPLWGLMSNKVGQVVMVGVVMAALLAVGWITDFEVPSPASRHGGNLSVRSLAAQTVGMVDSGAERWSRDIEARTGTWEWRTSWWREIWDNTHARSTYVLFGPGYGYPIWELHPYGTDDFPLRTPHNVFVYALGYTGWIGVGLFLFSIAALLAALATAWRFTGQCFGVCLWVMGVIRSLGDNFFESPHFAVVFFVLAGLSIWAASSSGKRSPSEGALVARGAGA